MKIATFPQHMVAMAQMRSLPELLGSVVSSICDCNLLGLARVWLVKGGDICATCSFRTACPDQSRCLHLAASAGNGLECGPVPSRHASAYARFPIGHRKIGRVAATGEPLLLTNLTGEEDWIVDPEWFRRAGIRTFAAQPLVYRGEVLGVLAIFDGMDLGEEEFRWLRIFADHAAASIAMANAYEEIAYLKERLEEENQYLRQEVNTVHDPGALVGESSAIKRLQQQIDLVAGTDATVLISGESGTGKELVARAIHERSRRGDRAMIAVNCGAIPEALFESEFFGHTKGAFTGAMRDKPGRFELADGGTLFLDEVGELPLPMQAKLLRVIQEQEVERVGDSRARKIDVRLIAATNRDLRTEVEAGRFRQDLYFRLSVFPVATTPLRERSDDVPALAKHFIGVSAQRMGRRAPRLTEGVTAQLLAYSWPGNVRELQNAMERAVILSQGGEILLDLPGDRSRVASPEPEMQAKPVLTRAALKEQERTSILAALAQSGGKVFGANGAAALLDMKATTLASRLKVLGIDARQLRIR